MHKNSLETIVSFRALLSLLKAISAEPARFNTNAELIDSLRSQGKISSYSDATLGITGRSLNTLKRAAEAECDEGFEAFDRLRLLALAAIENSCKHEVGKKVTKTTLLDEIADYKKSVSLLKEDLLLLTNAFEKSMSQAKHYAAQATDPAIRKLCENQQRAILRGLTLRNAPVDLKILKN